MNEDRSSRPGGDDDRVIEGEVVEAAEGPAPKRKRATRGYLPNTDKCGATTRAGGQHGEPPGRPCRQPAGFGTPNSSGPCRLHGGNGKPIQANARRRDAEKAATHELVKLDLWGARRDDLSPVEALAEELSRTAGRVQTLERRLQRLNEDESDTPRARGLVAELTAERGQLQRVAEAAERAGVTAKRGEAALERGEQLAVTLRGLFADLELTPTQLAALPALLRFHLEAMEARQQQGSKAGPKAGSKAGSKGPQPSQKARPPKPSQLGLGSGPVLQPGGRPASGSGSGPGSAPGVAAPKVSAPAPKTQASGAPSGQTARPTPAPAELSPERAELIALRDAVRARGAR